MKKFFAAMIMVCLSVAFCSSAMAQGHHRDNGRYGQSPAAVNHQPAHGNHVNAVPGNRPGAQPAMRHTQPAPPRHYHPAPPPPAPHHVRPLPPPEPAVGYRQGSGIYIGGEHFGIRISL